LKPGSISRERHRTYHCADANERRRSQMEDRTTESPLVDLLAAEVDAAE
jgi:hypothetical protein